ncbi:ATP-dependent DNA helicase [Candidatus Woesearchaeota archaeon]|nr:MAG: ATP-dependent DNA helicase [Candidatus Woesearchaeota archaeon]
MFFAHETLRPGQKELVEAIGKALSAGRHILVHAPTGLGKTAAALSPAIAYAKDRNISIVFLTSRHTQHRIVLETISKLQKRTGSKILVTSILGKKWMCAQEVENLPSGDFSDYCKSLVEGNKCEFYLNARGKGSFRAKEVIANVKAQGPLPAEEIVSQCKDARTCPYEVSLMLAEESDVIVADYYYIFHPRIRDAFLSKIKKSIEQLIVIVDEAHNLPARMRDVMTYRLSNRVIRLAIQEAKKYVLDDIIPSLAELQDVLNVLSNGKNERLVGKDEFIKGVNRSRPYDQLISELRLASEVVKENQQASHLSSIANFLEEWKSAEKGFARILSQDDLLTTLSLRCLDPALLTREVFDNCKSAIVMSGTLSPTGMYADVLGLENADVRSYPSPFPQENRLVLLVPRTTTKYKSRSENQFKAIACEIAKIANSIPGRIMVFFPSYFLRDKIELFLSELYDGELFYEKPRSNKVARQSLLEKFRSSKKGALLAAATGSFGEGVDLPGVLKGVIVVGLPLDRPDLETAELISYYDKKFGKGWDYGYTLPAMSRCIQNAGRCIRTETDRGVIAFIDERYVWPRYKDCFPQEWGAKVSLAPQEDVARFFGRLF